MYTVPVVITVIVPRISYSLLCDGLQVDARRRTKRAFEVLQRGVFRDWGGCRVMHLQVMFQDG